MIDEAIKIARNNKIADVHRIGCVITNKKGRIISTGYNNHKKSHPVQAKYAKIVGESDKIYLHAEVMALVKCRETPYNIYIARVTKGDNVKLAKPCPICYYAIKESGVRNIIYSGDNGNVHTMAVE